MKLTKIVETILYPFGIFLLDIYSRSGGFLNINPNPYLMVVILISLRFGTLYGIVGSVLSFIFFALSKYMMERTIKFLYENQSLILFFAFFASSIIFGLINDTYRHTIKEKEREIEEREEDIKGLKKKLENYSDEIKNLKKIITLERRGISMFLSYLSNMDLLYIEDVLNDSVRFVADFIGSESVSIYTIGQEGFLRLRVRYGTGILPNSFQIHDSIVVKNAMKDGISSVLDLLRSEEKGKFDVEPAIVARIDGRNETIGFLIVEILNPEDITRSTMAYTKMVANIVGFLIETSENLEESVIEKMRNEDGTLPIELMDKFLTYIYERYRDFKLPYSVVKIKLSKGKVKDLMSVIRKNVDIVFYDNENDIYVVLLQVCNSKGLEAFMNRLKKRLPEAEILHAETKE